MLVLTWSLSSDGIFSPNVAPKNRENGYFLDLDRFSGGRDKKCRCVFGWYVVAWQDWTLFSLNMWWFCSIWWSWKGFLNVAFLWTHMWSSCGWWEMLDHVWSGRTLRTSRIDEDKNYKNYKLRKDIEKLAQMLPCVLCFLVVLSWFVISIFLVCLKFLYPFMIHSCLWLICKFVKNTTRRKEDQNIK